MNTQMQEAFKAAGVKPKSLAERVWNFVKDNPNCTARTVEATYGASAAQALSDMFGRDMLKRSSMPTRDRQGKMRDVWITVSHLTPMSRCRASQSPSLAPNLPRRHSPWPWGR